MEFILINQYYTMALIGLHGLSGMALCEGVSTALQSVLKIIYTEIVQFGLYK